MWIIFLDSASSWIDSLLLSIENVEYIVVFWNGDTLDLDFSLDIFDFSFDLFDFSDFYDDFLWTPTPPIEFNLFRFPVDILPVNRCRLWKLINVELLVVPPFSFGSFVF